MRLILHGILAERFGAEHYIQTDVPAEAIEGLSRQLPDWPREVAVDVIDYPTEALLRSHTDDEEIHLAPAMYGGGGKWGQIIIGAVLVVAGILALPGPWGIPLILSGAGMILSGVSQMFMKAPTTNKSNDPAASKYLGVNKNTTAAGTLITNAWGRVKLSGHWLSLQSNADNLVNASFPVTPT